MIQFKNISKHYQLKGQTIRALDQINLEIPEGSIFGIIGYSGAGKSTLIRLINLLERPNEGQVIINQKDFTALDARLLRQERANIGMIFQHFNLLQTKTVAENIEMPMRLLNYNKAEREKRLNELLEFIDLKHKKDAYPDELSGGQKQRVGIARALVHHPEILLCDEATSALDPESTATILALLKKINQELGLTIVLITHEMQVIREICDQVVVIDQGEIVEAGQVWSVFSRPEQQITQELLNLEQITLPFKISPLPDEDSTHIIVKLKYEAEAHQVPDIQELLAKFKAPINLYQSQVDTIQGHIIGSLLVGIPNVEIDISSIRQDALTAIAQFEVLGYARPAH